MSLSGSYSVSGVKIALFAPSVSFYSTRFQSTGSPRCDLMPFNHLLINSHCLGNLEFHIISYNYVCYSH